MSDASLLDTETPREIVIDAHGTPPHGSAVGFTWWLDDIAAIGVTLTSSRDGVGLTFGPTVEVQHWPAWLREMTYFTEAGGVATLWLDPDHAVAPGPENRIALDIAGAQSRRAVAAFLHDLASALRIHFPDPSIEHRQAIETCTGVALALINVRDGIRPAQSVDDVWFHPSTAPIVIDDVSGDQTRHHVRLTYLLPRIAGWWTRACSLRIFRTEQSFGVEFRSLTGDHLPYAIRPACVDDDFGPILRFTVDRAGRGTVFEGTEEIPQAIRIVWAIVRQVSHDMALAPRLRHRSGFDGPAWQHWFAALPDLLAAPIPDPVETTVF